MSVLYHIFRNCASELIAYRFNAENLSPRKDALADATGGEGIGADNAMLKFAAIHVKETNDKLADVHSVFLSVLF